MNTLTLFKNILDAKENEYNTMIYCNGEYMELTEQQLKEVVEALENK